MENLNQKTILLVEDEAIIAMAEMKNLKGFGYDVVHANTGEKAVEFVVNNSAVSLVLMDINLGRGIDGPEAARQILAQGEIPIVFLTSHSEKEYVERVKEITRYGYVIKNSGDFVLQSSIEMGFELFEANKVLRTRDKMLAESETRYRCLFESAKDGILILDAKTGKIVDVNPFLVDLLGYSKEQFIAKSIWEIGFFKDILGNKDKFLELQQKQYVRYEDLPLETATGRSIAVEFVSNVYVAGHEKVIQCNIRDISDRKIAELERRQTEEALRENEERFHSIYMNSTIGFYRTTPAGAILLSNPALYKMLGYSSSMELATRNLEEENYQPEYDRTQFIEKIERDGRIIGLESRWIRADGSTVLVKENAWVIRDAHGKTLYYEGTAEDMTERKQAELQSEQLHSQIQSILSSISDAFFSLDKGLVVTYYNEAAGKALGKLQQEVIGRNLFDAFPEARGSIFEENYTRALREQIALTFEVYFGIAPYVNWYNVRVYPFANGISVYFQVITERKLTEEKINNLLAEKELLLKEVHHRMKNNMNTIVSLLDLQANTVQEPAANAALKDASRRLHSMGVLYEKLSQATGFDQISVQLYLPALVDEIVTNFPSSASVQVEKSIADFVLNTNTLQSLGIIINELFTNIMKYAFAGRDKGLITVFAALQDNRVSLAIQDNGKGMPDAVDFENSPGFGLQLVRMLTEQLDGSIRIERENGTRIVLEFPVDVQ